MFFFNWTRAVCWECGHWVRTLVTPASFTQRSHKSWSHHLATSQKKKVHANSCVWSYSVKTEDDSCVCTLALGKVWSKNGCNTFTLLFTDRRAVVWFRRQPVSAVCLLFKYLASVCQWEMLKTNYYHVRTACRNAPMSSQFEACSQWGWGTERLKIYLRQGRAVEKKEGGAKTYRERERERGVEKEFRETSSLAQAGSLGSPSLGPLFTHREISDNFTAPLSVAIEKGQIPSWLLTLYPVRVVAIMGKSKPLASSVGYLSALRYSLSANSGPE